jgi:transposase InsO family protein
MLQTRLGRSCKRWRLDKVWIAESFFHSFKIEAIYGCDIVTRREMEYEVFDYIEYFYSKRRKHSAIGLRSPEQFEAGILMNRKALA